METKIYSELINIIDNYMYGSGVRDYCRNICQGHCCSQYLEFSECHTNPNFSDCDSHLPCSLYLCDYVEAHIINYIENGEETVDLLREVCNITSAKLREVIDAQTPIEIYAQDFESNLTFELPDLSILENPQQVGVFISE